MIYLIISILSFALLFAAAVFVLGICKSASMADAAIQNMSGTSEQSIQERTNPVKWLVFHAVGAWTSVSYWLRFKRICAWHAPKPIRVGGNPLARKVTHGICPECFAKVSGEILSHDMPNINKAA